jgi:hypothetical protein
MTGCSRRSVRRNAVRSDAGFSMAVTVLSMGVVAILTALLLTSTLSSGSGSGTGAGTGIDNAPGVAEATSVQAQQTLSTALTTVSAAVASDGYGSLSSSTLSASNPSISFVDGASSNPTTVSISVVPGSDGGAGGVGGASGAAGAIGGIDGGAVSGDGVSGASSTGGSVTLADRSTGGTCWLVWKSAGAATWYGAQTDQPSCTAPALASVPAAGPVSSTSIGWQEGSFPAP